MRKIIITLFSSVLFYSCQVENINYSAPVMLTYEPQNVMTTSASIGGETLGEGGKDIVEYGLVWSTINPPTINDNKIVKGSRLGTFYDNYSVFSPETTYYYRAYGINETGIGYGQTFNFTTQGSPLCNPEIDNSIYTGIWFNTIGIYSIDLWKGNDTWGDGNVEFEAYSGSSGIRIFASFNEIGQRLPVTGTYKVVSGFDFQSPQSSGEVELFLYNYSSEIGGAEAVWGQNIYVENNNGKVSIIFCDTEFNQYYKLNGKFTYTE